LLGQIIAQRVQTPLLNESISIGARFSGTNENTEISASSIKKDKTSQIQKRISQTQHNDHLTANQSEERFDTRALTEKKNSSDQTTSHVLEESEMMPELCGNILKVRRFYSQEFNFVCKEANATVNVKQNN